MNRGQQITLLGAAVIIVGALLPWVTVTTAFGSMSVNGYEGDGLITGGLGLLVLVSALIAKGRPGKMYSVGGAVFGVIIGLLVFNTFSNVGGEVAKESSDLVRASVGSGLYASAVGCLLVTVGGLQRLPPAPEAP